MIKDDNYYAKLFFVVRRFPPKQPIEDLEKYCIQLLRLHFISERIEYDLSIHLNKA